MAILSGNTTLPSKKLNPYQPVMPKQVTTPNKATLTPPSQPKSFSQAPNLSQPKPATYKADSIANRAAVIAKRREYLKSTLAKRRVM